MCTYQIFQFLAVKRSNSFYRVLAFVLFFSVTISSVAQNKLQIVNGDLTIINTEDSRQGQWLYRNESGAATLRQKETQIESDSTKYFESRNYAEAIGNVYINQADSVDIYSDKANYFGNQRRLELTGEVALLKDVYSLQTERLNYNLNTRVATYTTGGELNDTTTTLTSIHGTYNLNTEVAVFKDSVVLISPDRKIETEELTYNMKNSWAYFNGPTTIYQENQIIKTTKGKYNTATGQAIVEGQPEIESDESYFSADEIQLEEKGGLGEAKGNVYYKDKVNLVELRSNTAKQLDKHTIEAVGNVDVFNQKDSLTLTAGKLNMNSELENYNAYTNALLTSLKDQTSLLADTLEVKQKNGYAYASGRPFLTTVQEEDSIFLIAKKMEAFRQDETPDSVYNFSLTEQIKLFKSDLQAVADSAYVNNVDSEITLFKNPVIWSDSTQMSADTIRILLKQNEVHKIEFRGNSFLANLSAPELYNQMKGKTMDAYFLNDEIDSLFVNGNAETIYYATDDDDGYIGIDKMQSGKIEVSFQNGELTEVFWLNQQEGTTYPFDSSTPSSFQLPGFNWLTAWRPTSKDFLLIAANRKQGELPDGALDMTLPTQNSQAPDKILKPVSPKKKGNKSPTIEGGFSKNKKRPK